MNIDELRSELEAATQAAYAAPRGVNEWPRVNELRAKLNAAIEAAKTPDQRQIEALREQIGRLERHVNCLDASLAGARNDNAALRHLIGLHTGKPTAKAIGLLGLDLARCRQLEDELAEAVRAGDLWRAQRICINRGLPRARPESLSADLQQIGLTGRTA